MQIEATLLPARGDDAVEIIENDHEVIKGLLNDLVSASGDRRKHVIEKLVGVLTIHNATEENLVYPALNEVAGSKTESQHLYHETMEADLLLFELDSLLKAGDDAKFATKAENFQKAVLHHIDEEENKALPRLQDVDAAQAESLTESVKQFRSSLHFETAT
jgi:hemerythrin superfamily protein